MTFQIKDFTSIVAAELNHARAVTEKITDFAPGSVARTLMEGPAVELEELYLQMFHGLSEAIPVATFKSFGFDKLPSKRAFGYVSVSSSAPLVEAVTIPVGSAFLTEDGARYAASTEVVWAAGSSLVRVPVVAGVTGLAGNVAAGAIVSSELFSASDGYVVSNALIANGADPETDAERQARFGDFIRSLSRGTVTACLYAAKLSAVYDIDGNIDQFVTRVGHDEVPGRVRIWIYSNQGSASPELLASGQALIDGSRDDATGTITPGYRAAGVQVDVLAMEERAVPMGIKVGMLAGYELTTAVEQDLSDIYDSAVREVMTGETLYLGTLVELFLAVPGVATVIPTATSNIVCGASEALTPGVLTIDEL